MTSAYCGSCGGAHGERAATSGHVGFDAALSMVCARAAREARAKMGKTPCVYCHKYYAPSSKTFDRAGARCAKREPCFARFAAKVAGAGKFSPRDGADVATDYYRSQEVAA